MKVEHVQDRHAENLQGVKVCCMKMNAYCTLSMKKFHKTITQTTKKYTIHLSLQGLAGIELSLDVERT